MKTFSVLLTFALLLLAQHLGARLKRAGLLPVARNAAELYDTRTFQDFQKSANPSYIHL